VEIVKAGRHHQFA